MSKLRFIKSLGANAEITQVSAVDEGNISILSAMKGLRNV